MSNLPLEATSPINPFSDWFSPNAQDYWTNEFELFYSPDTLDIDGSWIDMNEPSSVGFKPSEI